MMSAPASDGEPTEEGLPGFVTCGFTVVLATMTGILGLIGAHIDSGS
jgi:hypothetical protein